MIICGLNAQVKGFAWGHAPGRFFALFKSAHFQKIGSQKLEIQFINCYFGKIGLFGHAWEQIMGTVSVLLYLNPMDSPDIERLLQALKDDNADNRTAATEALWQIWFNQKGARGLQRLRQSQVLIDDGYLAEAEELLSRLIDDLPNFAEAWNRRAVLYFLQERYEEALADCQRVVELIPYHFGALHGLGLCHTALRQYRQAIQAFQQALAVQPYATTNQRLLLECTARLN